MANKVFYPFRYMRITQNYNGATSHRPHTTGTPKDYPIDEGERDTGKSPIYAPCDVKVIRIYGVGTKGTNTVWVTSVDKVEFADGTVDYLTMMIVHPDDVDLKNLSVGKVIKKGKQITKEGRDGATGYHIHLSCGSGTITNGGWVKNTNGKWVLSVTGKTKKPEDVFYIGSSVKVLNNGGMPFKKADDTIVYKTYKTTTDLRCREKPSLSGNIIKIYPSGTVINVIEIKDGWAKTEEGYCSADYIKKVKA